jgi:hypothetical protein
MLRLTRFLLIGAVLAGAGVSPGRGQVPDPGPDGALPVPRPAPGTVGEPDILGNLPRVADVPRSLYAPPPTAGPLPPDSERPYFQCDAVIDPSPLPQRGWFLSIDLDPTKGHVKNEISATVSNPATGKTDQVGPLSSAALNWAISPEFGVGYRLPSGFGEFLLAYRLLATQGSEAARGPDGPARLSSLLDINRVDLEYCSREVSLWRLSPKWNMRWWVGLRYASVYFDSRLDEPSDLAAAGSGVSQTRVTNSFVGIGPHAGVELLRRFGPSGFELVAKADYAMIVGRVRQQFFEQTTTPGLGGRSLVGTLSASDSQGVPLLNLEAGVGWRPPRYPRANFFAGYRYEYWWEVGRLDTISINNGSLGEVVDQGFVLRAEWSF